MIFPSIQIHLDKKIPLEIIYQFFEQMQKISLLKFCCLDLNSFIHLPQEILNLIEIKNYQFIGIYLAENIYPTFEIHQPLFESLEFQLAFNTCLKNCFPTLTYWRIDESVDFYQLIEFDSQGKKGKIITI